MSDPHLQVHADLYRRSSTGFDAIADDLVRVSRTMRDRHGAEGKCWGGDDTGTTFGQGYEPNVAAAMSKLGSLIERVGAVGDNVRTTADNYIHTDDGFSGRIGGVGGQTRWA